MGIGCRSRGRCTHDSGYTRDNRPDLVLVAIIARAVDVSVANLDGLQYMKERDEMHAIRHAPAAHTHVAPRAAAKRWTTRSTALSNVLPEMLAEGYA